VDFFTPGLSALFICFKIVDSRRKTHQLSGL